MNETVLDFDGAKKIYTSGENSLPRTFQSMANALGNSEDAKSLNIFKVGAVPPVRDWRIFEAYKCMHACTDAEVSMEPCAS